MKGNPFNTAPKDRPILAKLKEDAGFGIDVFLVQYDPPENQINYKGNDWKTPLADMWLGSDLFDSWVEVPKWEKIGPQPNLIGPDKYGSWGKLYRGQYPNGRPALLLKDPETGEPLLTLTVNIPDFPVGENCVLVRDWNETEGVPDMLVRANIAAYTGRRCPTGMVWAVEMMLTIDLATVPEAW